MNEVFLTRPSPLPGLNVFNMRIIPLRNENFYGPKGVAKVSSVLLAAFGMMIRMG
jgi:hypothetical protein